MGALTDKDERLLADAGIRSDATAHALVALVRRLAGRVETLEDMFTVKATAACQHVAPKEWWLQMTDEALDRMGPFTSEAEARAALQSPTEAPKDPNGCKCCNDGPFVCDVHKRGRTGAPTAPGEGATITQEEIREALKRGAESAMELGLRIAETFSLPTEQIRLSSATPTESTPSTVKGPTNSGTNSESTGADVDCNGGPRIYPCNDCGAMRSKAEGGTVFTVCDKCWDKHHPTGTTPTSEEKGE